MNERIKKLLGCFEPKMQKQLLDFCSRISKIQADVFILMARKASCFFNCLEELGLIHFDGYVTSERILDMDCEWLQGKRVVIIDDAIVSGTSINRTINKLIMAGVVSVQVHVLTVNEKWFKEDILTDEMGKSYLYPNCNVETNEKCIELCYKVVKSILLQPRPYDIDFPYFNRIEIKEGNLGILLNREGWDCYDITSVEQSANNILAVTIIPTDKKLKLFERKINTTFLNKCLVKLRIYATYKDKNKKMYSLRIVPMIVFDRMPIVEIENIFNEIIEQIDDRDYFKDMFNSATAKLRFLQFYFSAKFAEFWVLGLPQIAGISKEDLTFEDRNLSFIFPEEIEKKVEELCKCNIVHLSGHNILGTENKNIIEESNITGIDIISVETRLMEPFINKYYKKEIPCRELVLREGKRVFESEKYEELLQRLNTGITVYDMLKNIEYVKEYYDIYTRVSLFIDRAIDMGMIVPITQISNGQVFRAFRHGEDVLFGRREEILYLKMLHEFEKASRNGTGITHISTEKMIVLFSKIGIKKKFLQPYISNFTTNPKDDNGELCKVLRVKTYLKGPVGLVGDVAVHKKTKEKPYITEESKSIWFTNTFIQKQYILIAEDGLYHIPEIDTSSITSTDISEAENIAILFGQLSNPEVETGITLGDDELTKLATCLTMHDAIKAIAAEISIFTKEWEYVPLTYDRVKDEKILNERKNCKVYEALNSGYMKLLSYETGEAKEILKKVKFRSKIEQNLWESWFEDVLQEKSINGYLNRDVVALFEETKYLVFFLLYTYHVLISIQFITFKFYSESKKYAYIQDSYRKINVYEQLLDKMENPVSFCEEIDWKEIRKIKNTMDEIYPEESLNEKVSTKMEDTYIRQVNEYINKAIGEANSYLERVCCVLGERGRISKMHIYNHVLAITFFYKNELEQDYIYDKIDLCFQHILKTKASSEANLLQGEEVVVEYLSSKCYPDIEVGNNRDIVWFVAKGRGAEELMTKLALNIAYRLRNGVWFKEVYFGDISYKLSIKKSENQAADFLCNSFYHFVEEIPASLFQLKDNSSLIVSVVEKSVYKKNKFISFINGEGKAKVGYRRREKKNIDVMGSEYVTECYEQQYKYDPDKEQAMDKKDIGIITILEEEATAVIKILNLQEDEFKLGERLYYSGYLEGDDVTHSIIMTRQLSQGQISVVGAYEDMVKKYNPSVIFLVGIAGGITKDVDYCSVVLGTQIISYDLSKDTEDGIQRRGDVNKVHPALLPLYQRLLVKSKNSPIRAVSNSKEEFIHIHESNIASGSAVIANSLSDITKWIHNYNDKTDATEMEAYGLSTAFYEGQLSKKHPKYGVAVIRGISDMADKNKSKVKKYRVPAAENAVIVLKELIRLIPRL